MAVDFRDTPMDAKEHPDTSMPSREYWGSSISRDINSIGDNMRANELVRSNRGTAPRAD